MNKKLFGRLLPVPALIAVAVLTLSTVFCIRNTIKSNIKKDGFDSVLKGMDICALSIKNDSIYAGGAAGLFTVDMADLKTNKIGDYRYVRAILDTDDGLWIGHDFGLTFSGGQTLTFTTKDGLPDNRVNALMLDGNHTLWIGTWGGAASFNGKNFTVYKEKNGLLCDMVNVIMQDSYGCVWFGSYIAPRGGISVFSHGKWQYFTTNDALMHANINAIIETRKKSVIAGGGLYTKGGGTRFIYKDNIWTKCGNVTKNDGIAGDKIRSLFEDSQSRLWVGSEYDGLAVLSETGSIKLDKTNGLPNNEVKIIKEDKYGYIWIGTRGGLTRISKEGLEQLDKTQKEV